MANKTTSHISTKIYPQRIKMFLCKIITCIFPKKYRKNIRNYLFYFSLKDYLYFKRQNYHIVSLGHNCLIRVVTTAVKLKPRKMYGEKSCPFDLANHNSLKQINQLIKTDFKYFFDDLEFQQNIWINKKINSQYVHEEHFSKEKFEKRYKQRIQNFLNILNSEKTVYFIYSSLNKPINSNEIEELYNILKQKRQNKKFKLIILCSEHIQVNKEIIQIISNFKINSGMWVEFSTNIYKNYDNEYTEFTDTVGKELKKFIL